MSKRTRKSINPGVAELEAALLRSIDQAACGEGRVTTAEHIIARRDHAVDSVKPKPKPTPRY